MSALFPKVAWRNAVLAVGVGIVIAVITALQYRPAPAPAAPAGYTYFGNAATGDLDGDGAADTAFIVTKQPGGSGTFYYVTARLSASGNAPSNLILLGDRIAPQTTEIRDGLLIVNYADRKMTDSFATAPSIAVSKYLRVQNGALFAVDPVADDQIVIDQPLPGATIRSPLTITGRAKGTWFFEASFPVILTDWDGRIILQTPAHATADWMTSGWVPFEVTLTFTAPDTTVSARGAITFKKDNPSGLPEHDASREMTVFFGK